MAAMEQYVDAHTHRRFRNCVVCFCHVYHKDDPEHRVWNYDNLELKQILDVVGVWLLMDDSGLLYMPTTPLNWTIWSVPVCLLWKNPGFRRGWRSVGWAFKTSWASEQIC